MGDFTGICLPDDNPEHVAWVRACQPAIDRARDALNMQVILMPIEFPSTDPPWQRVRPYGKLSQIPTAMLATAALETADWRDPQSVLSLFRDSLALPSYAKRHPRHLAP